jgi:predicted tellurium resistance membrane protein TerC
MVCMDFLPLLASGGSIDANVELLSAAGLGALLTLTLMEIVLGIDNVVFIAILVAKLPANQQTLGRNLGMGLALLLRLGLLFSITWIMGLTNTLITLPEFMQNEADTGLSGRDLILLAGGLFLLYKSSKEIFEKLEGEEHHSEGGGGTSAFGTIIFQIIVLDLVFSLDSVITAVGMVKNLTIMIVAMFIAVGAMIASAGMIGNFVQRHPSIKILALSFLNMIGVMLVLEGFGTHINKGYIYSAMAFSLLVELVNMRYRAKRKKSQPVKLYEPTVQDAGLKE